MQGERFQGERSLITVIYKTSSIAFEKHGSVPSREHGRRIHPPRTLDSLEERQNRQERRRTQLTPTNARVMSYPRVRADSRESTSRESTFRESAATESERTISRESTPPSSTESTPPLDPPERACPGEPPDEAPAGACILPSYSNPGSSVSLSFV